MKIDRNNYEAFFLDCHEGTISSADKAKLDKFLSENGDLEREFQDFVNISIQPEKIVYQAKSFLKKELSDVSVINSENFDEFCVAKLEGDLLENENVTFEKYLNNNANSAIDYKIYLKTLLEPDKSIVFNNKSQLKRRELQKKTNPVYFWLSAAASIAALLVLYFSFNKPNELKTLAKNEIQIEKPKNQQNEFHGITQQKESSKIENSEVVGQKNSKSELKQTETLIDKVKGIEAQPSGLTSIQSIYLSKLPEKNIDQALCLANGISTNQYDKHETVANNSANLKDLLMSKVNSVINSNYLSYFTDDRLDIKALTISGLTSLEKFTGTKVEYDKETGSYGNRTIYAFNSKLLSFYSSHENK
jgi:hypothetical protein